MLNAATYGLRGDIAVAEDDLQAAVENFKKAVAASDDEHSFITYSEKLARVYNALGDNQAAMQCYKDIVAKYPDLGVNPNEVSVDGVSNRSAAYFKRFIW
jgi:tetratricopeptide (TPR) repeat protein